MRKWDVQLTGLRVALLSALGWTGCSSRPLEDLGPGEGSSGAPPGTGATAGTTGGPMTTAGTTGEPTTTAGTTTAAGTTTTGATTTAGSTGAAGTTDASGSSGEGSTTEAVEPGTSTGTGETTAAPDLPCVNIGTLGMTLPPEEVPTLPGCEGSEVSGCHDYVKICAPRPDGVESCEACAPDCVGALPELCDAFIRQAVCGPVAEGEQCCHVYEYGWNCTDGRPFRVEGATRTAAPVRGAAWTGEARPALLAELDAAARRSLAALWTADGMAEHASVAAFARFTLQLLAHAAPPGLVAEACAAQVDEVRHARAALGLAAAYGAAVAPGPLATAGALAGSQDAEALLVATLIEGCVGETIAAAELRCAAEGCADPAVAAVLRATADDEQRHAALAWRTVRWLLRAGAPALRGAMSAALAAVHVPAPPPDTLPPTLLRRHGRLPASERAALARRCLEVVIRPCAASLLTEAASARA